MATSHDGRIGLLWATVWDTEQDAAEFETTATALIAKRFPAGGVVLRAGQRVLAAGGLGETAHAELERFDLATVLEVRAWEDEADATEEDVR